MRRRQPRMGFLEREPSAAIHFLLVTQVVFTAGNEPHSHGWQRRFTAFGNAYDFIMLDNAYVFVGGGTLVIILLF